MITEITKDIGVAVRCIKWGYWRSKRDVFLNDKKLEFKFFDISNPLNSIMDDDSLLSDLFNNCHKYYVRWEINENSERPYRLNSSLWIDHG